MKLVIKNIDLVNVIKFLDQLDLAGLKGVHRTNLSLKLQEQLKYVMETEEKLKDELKDDKKKFNEDLTALHDECAVIDTGDSKAMLESVKNTIKEIVEKEESTFKGQEAYGLAILYNALEINAE